MNVLVDLPLVLPPVVTGYLLLVCFAPHSPIGAALCDWFGLKIPFTWLGAVLASAIVGFPLMVRAARLAFQGIDPRLELAARSLGTGRLGTFFTVSLPLARRGVITAWLLGFARSLGEFGATIMIAGNIEGTDPHYSSCHLHSRQSAQWDRAVVAAGDIIDPRGVRGACRVRTRGTQTTEGRCYLERLYHLKQPCPVTPLQKRQRDDASEPE